ncbi:MAG: hypothetical protein Ct9H300mP28_08550 [Pseudomonadota bacterium]|nr:MAG: hypothetical protein Ct9H300mP28_08550 [Pseudomonadota bacterium]
MELMDSTLIIFTSDHGDYLGDHWLGEKDLFHEPSVRIPLIVYDPDTRAKESRASLNEEFVEAVDILPTIVEFAGGKVCKQRVEGKSLLSFTRGIDGLNIDVNTLSVKLITVTEVRVSP